MPREISSIAVETIVCGLLLSILEGGKCDAYSPKSDSSIPHIGLACN